MPRKAPKEVIEHRITLGNFERDLVTKELADSKENKMYVAGINQVGQIAGSGVLLWGLAAYFGYNLIDEATDKVKAWINTTSTGLANGYSQVFGGLTASEAAWIAELNEQLNARVRELNRLEQLDEVAITGATAQLRAGVITYDMWKGILDAVGEIPKPEQLAERQAIVNARAKLARAKAIMGESWLENTIAGWNITTPGSILAETINNLY